MKTALIFLALAAPLFFLSRLLNVSGPLVFLLGFLAVFYVAATADARKAGSAWREIGYGMALFATFQGGVIALALLIR